VRQRHVEFRSYPTHLVEARAWRGRRTRRREGREGEGRWEGVHSRIKEGKEGRRERGRKEGKREEGGCD